MNDFETTCKFCSAEITGPSHFCTGLDKEVTTAHPEEIQSEEKTIDLAQETEIAPEEEKIETPKETKKKKKGN